MEHLFAIFLVVVCICTAISAFVLKKEKQTKATIFHFAIISSIFSFFLSVLFVRLALNKSVFLIQTSQGLVLYDVLLIVLSVAVIALIIFVKGKLPQRELKKAPLWKKIGGGIWKLIMIALFSIGVFLWLGAEWFIGFFGELTPEQFLFNLNSPIKGTSSGVSNHMSHTPVLLVISIAAVFLTFFFVRIPEADKEKISWYKKRGMLRTVLLSFVSFVMLTFGVNYSIQTLHLMEVYRAYTEGATYIQDNYINPSKTNLRFPEKKRNLIHIYAESVESSYFSKELGGYSDENLMPNLYELSKSGVHFSHNDKMGGSRQTYGSSWSVAGMVNMECGVPLKIPMDGNSYGKEGDFLPGITNLGDLLHQQGYNQTIMFGADAEFGGLDVYFTQHGKYHIFDVKEARKQGLIPQDYNVWWGFEDDKLYDFAKNEITRLYKEGKPFHFNMENADTHFPDGYVSKDLKRSRASQYADVIAYSDEQLTNFVKWIQAQPFYENTTIVITGDHLSMDKNFFKNFDPNYQRTPLNIFLNAPVNKDALNTKNRQFAPLDMFPTIVSSLGVEIPGNRLGLGTNLFSGQQTLMEKVGFDKFNQELGKRSDFYDTQFIASTKKRTE